MDEHETAMEAVYAKFREVWGEDPHLTARRAFGIAAGLDYFADAEISRWLADPAAEPLHEVSPFDQLEPRVMMLVGENRAWAALAAERCIMVAGTFPEGAVSFFSPDAAALCYFDELVVATAVTWNRRADNGGHRQVGLFERDPLVLDRVLRGVPGWAVPICIK